MAAHFNQPGYSIDHFKVTAIAHCQKTNKQQTKNKNKNKKQKSHRINRENFWQHQLRTYHLEINCLSGFKNTLSVPMYELTPPLTKTRCLSKANSPREPASMGITLTSKSLWSCLWTLI